MDDETLLCAIMGTASSAESAAVAAYRRRSPANEKRYRRLKVLLQAATDTESAREVNPPPSEQLIIAKAEEPSSRRRHRILGIGTAAAAAVAAVALGLSMVSGHGRVEPVFQAAEFASGPRETAQLRLPDGSLVLLAHSSRLTLLPAAGERRARLEGQAFFAVSPSEEFPFTIETKAGDVTVLGTRFDLQSTSDSLRLVVVEGAVSLRAGGVETVVQAGQESGVIEGVVRTPVTAENVDAATAWIGDRTAYQGAPLAEVAADLKRKHGIEIVFSDSAIARRAVTMWLGDHSLNQALSVICTIADARCRLGQDSVWVSRRH